MIRFAFSHSINTTVKEVKNKWQIKEAVTQTN